MLKIKEHPRADSQVAFVNQDCTGGMLRGVIVPLERQRRPPALNSGNTRESRYPARHVPSAHKYIRVPPRVNLTQGPFHRPPIIKRSIRIDLLTAPSANPAPKHLGRHPPHRLRSLERYYHAHFPLPQTECRAERIVQFIAMDSAVVFQPFVNAHLNLRFQVQVLRRNHIGNRSGSAD